MAYAYSFKKGDGFSGVVRAFNLTRVAANASSALRLSASATSGLMQNTIAEHGMTPYFYKKLAETQHKNLRILWTT